MIDLLLLAIVGLVAWCVASEGAFGAAITMLCVIFSGLIAMNFFEPLAIFLEANTPRWIGPRADFIALVGLFGLGVFLMRLGTDSIAPSTIEFHPLVFQGMRVICAGLTGYITMAILLTALHTAALPRNFLGFTPERKNFLNAMSPDRQWLGFTQQTTEYMFRKRLRANPPAYHAFDTIDWPMPNAGEPPRKLATFIFRYADRRERLAVRGAGGGAVKVVEPAAGGSTPAPPQSAF